MNTPTPNPALTAVAVAVVEPMAAPVCCGAPMTWETFLGAWLCTRCEGRR